MKEQTTSEHPLTARVTEGAEQAVEAAAPWIERLGRYGYIVTGIVYVLVGWFAALAAAGLGGGTTDQRGALQWLEDAPFGRFLLLAIAVGLVGLAVWRFTQAIRDTEHKGSSWKGLSVRGVSFCIGLVNAALAWSAVNIVMSVGRQVSTEKIQRGWTAWLLAQPFGWLLLGLIGLGFVGGGVFQLYKTYTGKLHEPLEWGEISRRKQRWIVWFGQIGFAARGVVFGLIGGFFIAAARQFDARRSRGLGGTLLELSRQPYGPWLLGLTAAGLIAFGVFSIMLARYRRMAIE